MTQVFDVAVLGLGAMGSASAWACAREGLRVVGLERFDPIHARGSSHGETRAIRQAYFESPDYVPLVLRAYELWRDIERESGQSLLTLCGGLMVGREDSQVFSGSLRSARTHGLPHEVLDPDAIAARWPPFRPAADQLGLYEPRAGILAAEPCVAALQSLARRHGATLKFNQPVIDLTVADDAVDLVTANGRLSARRLIVTAGAWSSQWLAGWRLPLQPMRVAMRWFRPRGAIEAYRPDRFPVHIWEMPDGACFYGMPAMAGADEVKTGFHSRMTPCDPDATATADPTEEGDLRALLSRFLPELADPARRTVGCMYTMTPDGHFVVGPHPAAPPVLLACGFSGHGFKFAPAIGEAMASLAAARDWPFSRGVFAPTRFATQSPP